MNAPFPRPRVHLENWPLRFADLGDPGEARRIEAFVAAHPGGTAFHRPAWLEGVAQGTGCKLHALVAERDGELAAFLPLHEIHSPVFGRLLASAGFGIDGGVLGDCAAERLFAAAEELARRLSCTAIELRGGRLPQGREGWALRRDSHCGFASPLACNDEAQLLAIPRKQRADVRKGLANDLLVEVGRGESDRAAHYAVYAESVRNLGTPVFPRALFHSVLDRFGDDADILTVRHQGRPIASVLSLYHRGAVMPYWGGGTAAARALRGNDRMYFALMCHARRRGCTMFDFGRSKTGSGAWHFKRNWGFEPEPLAYAIWTAPGAPIRDASPASARHAARIAMWRKLPLGIANRLGPMIARGLG